MAGLVVVLITKFINLPSHQEKAREKLLHNTPDPDTACVKWWIYYLPVSNNTWHTAPVPRPLHS